MNFDRIQHLLERFASWADRKTGGAVGVTRWAVQRFNRVRGSEAAASMSYYAIFSLFPLLLSLVSLIGYLLVNVAEPVRVMELVTQVLPVARDLILENILEILDSRGTGGLIGLVGLIWSASGIFLTLARNINRAWPGASTRSFIQGRLVAFSMIALLTFLILIWLVSTALFSLLPRLEIPIRGGGLIYQTFFWTVLSTLVPWLLAFAIFINLYRWVPNTRVRWREAFWGAIFATVAWETTNRLFTWFLSSGMARYELVYGSLGTVVALLTWVYISSLITIFGAHISSAVAHFRRLKQTV